jgi:RHS repeat-associated protein
LHQDHLGSIAVISNELGAVLERLAYDPWGKRRFANGVIDELDTLVGQNTDRGYTEHEHLDEVGAIHMNGRIYDPLIGRMMSADIMVPDAGNLQAYNRYSYVINNPLSLTDPSGFFFDKIVSGVNDALSGGYAYIWSAFGNDWNQRYSSGKEWLNGPNGYQLYSTAISVASALYCGSMAPVCNGVGQAALASGYGAPDSKALEIGAIAGANAYMFQLAGDGVDAGLYAKHSLGHYGAHAAAGCISAVAGKQACGSGAGAAVVGLYATQITSGSGWNGYTRGIAVAASGGVGSVLAGGSFANGARTAAYGYLFNCLAHQCYLRKMGDELRFPNSPGSPEAAKMAREGLKLAVQMNPYGRGIVNTVDVVSIVYDTINQNYVDAGVTLGGVIYSASVESAAIAVGVPQPIAGRVGAFAGALYDRVIGYFKN